MLTARLRLRRWRDEDLEPLARLNSDAVFVRYLTGRPATRAESEQQLARFRRHWDEHGFGLWAVDERESGRFVGRIGLQYHRLWPHDPEVGWGLEPDVWGRGYATEGGAAALRCAFETLGCPRVVSIVRADNVRSLRVMERLGLAPWREVWWEEGRMQLAVHAIGRDAWEARLQSAR